ncbi:xanthine dehydrogenase family protein molybdopterin-binding subunit [Massilia sp. TS11]|uniref:xanthine dehydrogenase family protein molybdopterin-binding subunit n=1 Tax=Massilia sp. TS11 TaxID=2908003 RepID=UPI001EDB7694|nr:xanthine dehydrogenase family protein molybdopterin-binding subunit [Massilia sp. TS11]MCG2586743.1 xanthine dehydrogenase family protein molybdopterin-binding subunit [Massilia sp. TS11]
MRSEWMQALPQPAAPTGGLSRRAFLKAAGAGLVISFYVPLARAQGAAPAPSQPNAFLRIGPDNSITVAINRLEFGQGVHTGLSMAIAEELEVDWKQMRAELAPAGAAYFDPAFGMQMTGGSGSIAHSFTQYREVGARARQMLVAAAAAQWNCKADACTCAKGMVMGPDGRKASYGQLAQAATQQKLPEKVSLKSPKDFKFIGKPMPRLDARDKSTGKQVFGMDFKPAGTKVVVIARPPVFGAKVAKFDASRAKAIRGVLDVIEVPLDRGARGLAIIADGFWPAKQGREALAIEWDTSAVEKVDTAAQMAQFKALAKTPGTIAHAADVGALATAPKKISAVYEFPYLAHAPMEPLNCVIEAGDGKCTVWAGSQFQTFDQMAVAGVLGLKPEQVTLHTMMAGGGFGRRAVPTSDYLVEAAHIAKAWQAAGQRGPLKVIWTREDDIRGGYYRPAHVHRAEIGLDDKGRILAWDHTIVGQSIITGSPFEAFMVKNGVDATMVEGMGEPYAVPLKLSVHNAKANVPVLWWRSVGSTHTAFVMETLLDEAAALAGVDPVAYRKQLIGDKHPRVTAALDLAVAKSGYGKKALPKGRAYGVAVHQSFNSVVAYVVEVSLVNGAPKVHKVTAGVHCNLAVNPLSVAAQVEGAALMGLGTTLPGAAITFKNGEVEQRNFDSYSMARMHDMPQVAVHIVPSTEAPTGMGEPGLPALAPAVANAIAKLTGKRLRKLPFDLASA